MQLKSILVVDKHLFVSYTPGVRGKHRVSEIDFSRTPGCGRQAPGVLRSIYPSLAVRQLF